MDLTDISKHSNKTDCWVVINNKVYDVTKYLDEHPGGSDIILDCAGKDATSEFTQIGHSKNAIKILDKYEIGQLIQPVNVEKKEQTRTLFNTIWEWLFPPKPDTRAHLIQRSQITHDTIRLMFVVPRIDLKCGQHIICSNGDIKRKYTPVHTTHNSFDIIVKVYDTGGMSSYLNTLQIGDRLTVSEPVGNKIYLGNGTFSNMNIQAQKILMICAGTGITPMYPILRKIVDNCEKIQVNILYVNKTESDIILQDELDHICLKSSNITIKYVFTRVTKQVKQSLYGRPTIEMISNLGGCDIALICGPTGFNDSVANICKELEYPTQVF